MERIILLALTCIFLFSGLSVYAQGDEEEIKIPPGMELIQIGDNVFKIVPKGTKVRKEDTRIITERTSAYISRKLLEIEERLTQLEAKEIELRESIEQLNMQAGQ